MTSKKSPKHQAIAVVGMACRFPGAANVEEFWEVLQAGRSTVQPMPQDSAHNGVAGISQQGLLRVNTFGALANIDQFDYRLFGLTRREATLLDPQHRIWLETVWRALEDAGVGSPQDYLTAVFAGANRSSYLEQNIKSDNKWASRLLAESSSATRQILNANDKEFLPLRTSYLFDLKGPSINVQTACSTALVAVTQSCQALRDGSADLAIAGGVSVTRTTSRQQFVDAGSIHSASGHCRPFDQSADGTVFGDGAGAVILRRYEDAVRHGDRIYALIDGWGISNDGGNKASFAAPSARSQATAIKQAHAMAGYEPASVSYVEAHGTGTRVGDPIEFEGIRLALGNANERCGIGSVKSNVGHLDNAAGSAGLLKLCLMLYHGRYVPSLGCDIPNPLLRIDNSRFYVVSDERPWSGERRGGVSSLGVGGTNCHLALSAAPLVDTQSTIHPASEPTISNMREQHYLLTVSAHSQEALEHLCTAHIEALREPKVDVASYCRDANQGRRSLPLRRAVVGANAAELAEALSNAKNIAAVPVPPGAPRVCFVYPGQLSAFQGMAAQLFSNEPVFRQAVQRCERHLTHQLDVPLQQLLFESTPHLQNTRYEQPALFCLQVALTDMWRAWGITPYAVLGYSLGEFAAAYAAQAASLEELLTLVCARAHQMDSNATDGAMLSVWASADQTARDLDPALGFCIAGELTAELCSLSGPADRLPGVEAHLTEIGLRYRVLSTRYAFHSAWVDASLDTITAAAEKVQWNKPVCHFVSSVAQTRGTADIGTGHYWREQARQPVAFDAALQRTADLGIQHFVELGPDDRLCRTLAASDRVSGALTVASLLPGEPDTRQVLRSAGALYAAGQRLNWPKLHVTSTGPRWQTPTYPFQRVSLWVGEHPPTKNHSMQFSWEPGTELLEAHRLFDIAVVPASAHLAWIIDCVKQQWPQQSFELRDLIFLRPLAVADDTVNVQLNLVQSQHSPLSFELTATKREVVETSPLSAVSQADYITGQLHIIVPGTELSETSTIEFPSNEMEQTVPGTQFYENRWGQQATGAVLRAVRSVRYATDIAHSEITIRPALPRFSGPSYPTLEACFQTLYAATTIETAQSIDQQQETWVPYAIDKLCFADYAADNQLNALARHKPELRTDSSVVGDLDLTDTNARVLVSFRGFQLRPVSAAALSPPTPHVYRPEYIEIPFFQRPEASLARARLVLSESGNTLPARLSNTEDVIYTTIDPTGGIDRVRIVALLDSLASAEAIDIVMSTSQSGVTGCRALIELSELLDARDDLRISLTLHTENQTETAALHGFARVLLHERPSWSLKGASRPKFVPCALPNKTIQLRKDRGYLVIGNGGNQCLATIAWLKSLGAGDVTMAIMNPATEESPVASQLADRLIFSAVQSTTDASELLAQASLAAPLDGLFAIPWLMDDASLGNQHWSRFSAAVEPITSALDFISKATEDMTLRHFVCFSSSASVLGSPGQASYAACCSHLDALCTTRRRQGLAGLAINWGPWAGMGNWQHTDSMANAAVRSRWNLLDPQQALDILGRALAERELDRLCVLPQTNRLDQNDVVSGNTTAATDDAATAGSVLRPETSFDGIALLSELVGEDVRQLPPATLLGDIGLDSLMAVVLRNRLRSELSLEISLRELLGEQSLANAARWVSAPVTNAPPPKIQPGTPAIEPLAPIATSTTSATSAASPVFCFHWLSAYRALADELGAEHPVQVVWLGEESNSEASKSLAIEVIAARYVETIRSAQPEGPYRLLGSSFAGAIAFEVAQQLMQANQQISLLALIDANAPSVVASRSARLSFLWQQARELNLSTLFPRAFQHLTMAFKRKVENNSATSARNATREPALRDYQPKSYRGRVLLFVATENSFRYQRPADLGWQRYVDGGLTLHKLSGDHHAMTTAAGAAELSAVLRPHLSN